VIVRSLIFLMAANVALCLSVTPAASEPAPPVQSPAKSAPTQPERPPLVFYVAKGEDNACGEGCSEWIAAEGYFDLGAAQRLRAFLQRHSKRKLPIYFQSPGGIVGQALAIGRLLRERAMTAGVARTVPRDCPPREPNKDTCRSLKQSGRELAAELRPVNASCNSSCVYALIGGKLRQVPPGARLGVHSGRLIRISTRDGQVKSITVDAQSARAKAKAPDVDGELRRYIRDMGVDEGLLALAMKIPFEQIRYLSRDEVAGFGIDRRGFQESRWTIVDTPTPPPAVMKVLIEAKGPSGKEFRTSLVRLSCRSATQFTFAYIRGLASDEIDRLISIRVTSGDRNITFPRIGRVSKLDAIDFGGTFDTRAMVVPIEFFDVAAAGETIDVTETDLADPALPLRVSKLSTAGLRAGIDVLGQRCANPS
jgi:hypothetical protein